MKHDEEWLDDNHMIKGDQRKDWGYSQAVKGYAKGYAEHLSEWTLANEEKPEHMERVNTYRLGVNRSMCVAWYNHEKEQWFNEIGWSIKVTHWKRIGELPK